MTHVEPDLKRVWGVWWLLAWRGFVGFSLLGFFIAFIVGGYGLESIANLLGLHHDTVVMVGRAGGLVIGIVVAVAWGLAVTKMALRKKYRGFQIVLVPNADGRTT